MTAGRTADAGTECVDRGSDLTTGLLSIEAALAEYDGFLHLIPGLRKCDGPSAKVSAAATTARSRHCELGGSVPIAVIRIAVIGDASGGADHVCSLVQSVRCRFAPQSRWRHRPRCRDNGPCFRSLNVRATVIDANGDDIAAVELAIDRQLTSLHAGPGTTCLLRATRSSSRFPQPGYRREFADPHVATALRAVAGSCASCTICYIVWLIGKW